MGNGYSTISQYSLSSTKKFFSIFFQKKRNQCFPVSNRSAFSASFTRIKLRFSPVSLSENSFFVARHQHTVVKIAFCTIYRCRLIHIFSFWAISRQTVRIFLPHIIHILWSTFPFAQYTDAKSLSYLAFGHVPVST